MSRSDAFRWDEHPSAGETSLQRLTCVDEPTPIVALSVWLVRERHGHADHYSVVETARLEDGREVCLSDERGWTESLVLGDASGPQPGGEDAERDLVETVRVVVGPDEGESAAQPWTRLADAAQARGLTVTADELRDLPYRVRTEPPPPVV